MKKADVTQERLKDLLHYDPETGCFTWRVPHKRIGQGRVAGTMTRKGTRSIGIDGRVYTANKLAYLYMENRWPVGMVSYRDNDTENDKWTNLYEVENDLSQLKEVLHYDPETGHFTWRVRHRGARRGRNAGCTNSSGYRSIYLGGKKGRTYLAHRLAFFYMTGRWPTQEIDHKDRNPLNNRWDNLRGYTATERAEQVNPKK